MKCDWIHLDGERVRCRRCGVTRWGERDRECTTATPGLGDFTENVLKSIGVTKERYIEAKKLFGLSPTCNCELRKQWLNRVSDWWRGQS